MAYSVDTVQMCKLGVAVIVVPVHFFLIVSNTGSPTAAPDKENENRGENANDDPYSFHGVTTSFATMIIRSLRFAPLQVERVKSGSPFSGIEPT